jgi:hypothetical protein
VDQTPASRSHCTGCPSFISFRSFENVETVGCSWGEDTAAWLRREMAAGRPARLRAPKPKRRPRFAPGASFGLFLTALGVGIALSALEASE